MASRLRERGAKHEGRAPFKQYNVRDGNPSTGQNSASSARMAEDVIAAVRGR